MKYCILTTTMHVHLQYHRKTFDRVHEALFELKNSEFCYTIRYKSVKPQDDYESAFVLVAQVALNPSCDGTKYNSSTLG